MQPTNIGKIASSIVVILLLQIACSQGGLEITAPAVALPSLVPLATLPATAVGTAVPSPTLKPLLPPTNTPLVTQTPTAIAEETPTPLPISLPPTSTTTPVTTPIDRRCPDPAPPRPDYDRLNLGAQPWATLSANPAEISSHFTFIKPVPGGGRTIINKSFPYGSDGGNRYLLHNGIDISGAFDMPVFAVADATVVVAQEDELERFGWRCDWYGQLVILELDETWLDQPLYVLYGHVLDIAVEVGQHVAQGETLAEVGIGGAAISPHLHLEVRVGRNTFDATQNPMLWIDPGPTRGIVVGRLVDPDGRPWHGVTLTLIREEKDELEFINTYSYMSDSQNLINPDQYWAENFLFADVVPGKYQLFTEVQGIQYRQAVTVTGGEISFAEIVTDPYKTPTPTPEVSATPTSTLDP